MTKAGLRIVLLMCSSLFYLHLIIGFPGVAAGSSDMADSSVPELTLTGPSGTVSEGYFRLRVEGYVPPPQPSSETQLLFEQSASEDFESVSHRYSPMGEFTQISLSGFSGGRYYFRAVVLQGADSERMAVSNTVIVEVKHHSLSRSLTLFALGAAIFILLVSTILGYHLRTKREGTYHE